MQVKLVFCNPSNSRFTPKNAEIMFDSHSNATWFQKMPCQFVVKLLIQVLCTVEQLVHG